mgnify:CR=1 FL=1
MDLYHYRRGGLKNFKFTDNFQIDNVPGDVRVSRVSPSCCDVTRFCFSNIRNTIYLTSTHLVAIKRTLINYHPRKHDARSIFINIGCCNYHVPLVAIIGLRSKRSNLSFENSLEGMYYYHR